MKIKAINDMVIVLEDLESEKTSKGGVIIPTAVINQPHKVGTVVSAGPVVGDSIKAGDKVVYHSRGGQVMAIDESKIYKALHLPEIYCVLEEEDLFCDCSSCGAACEASKEKK